MKQVLNINGHPYTIRHNYHPRSNGSHYDSLRVDLPVGIQEKSGRSRFRSYYGADCKILSERVEQSLLHKEPNYSGPPDLTVAQLCDQVMLIKRSILKPSTLSVYENLKKIWIQPYIGPLPVRELTVEKMVSYYTLIIQKKITGSRLTYLYTFMNQLFLFLIRKRQMRSNPQDQLQILIPLKKPDRKPLSIDQLAYLFEQKEHPFYLIYILLLLTGLRRGEVLGLSWDDVDLQQKTLIVHQQVQRIKNPSGHYKTTLVPYTKTGVIHTLHLSDAACDVLKEQRLRQLKWMRSNQNYHNPNRLVFTKPDGNMLSPDRITNKFQLLMQPLGCSGITLHSLRHTAASLVLERTGSLQVTQDMLGHRHGQTTLQYCHTSQDALKTFADQIGATIESIIHQNCTDSNLSEKGGKPSCLEEE